jgi:hypothetical protein
MVTAISQISVYRSQSSLLCSILDLSITSAILIHMFLHTHTLYQLYYTIILACALRSKTEQILLVTGDVRGFGTYCGVSCTITGPFIFQLLQLPLLIPCKERKPTQGSKCDVWARHASWPGDYQWTWLTASTGKVLSCMPQCLAIGRPQVCLDCETSAPHWSKHQDIVVLCNIIFRVS